MHTTALVLFSGGQDSTVCLAQALSRYERVETIGFDYRQRHSVELQARLVVLLPRAWEERRDHALVLAELGAHGPAAEALALYLHHRPEAVDAPALRRHLAAWQQGH